ncbi:TadE/TadG family type IV pilus assembly protein [Phenylobacterium montanum]|uniref:Pilus assembly protein n=1 Tax=Phenylobacterium montanum TaxID=2823693 RepID=A0A975FZP8_9CAUL|nr:TadE/TadG family type IV pilus assembly protein [Caulobacter sp. S6]QUD88240.1 pilus assembly protein [Caulobacter sp. S6]
MNHLRFQDLFGCFWRDRKGATAMIFVLALPVIMACVGGAIDYSGRLTAQGQLQDAVDAASVGAVATNSAAFIAGQNMTSDGLIPVGVTNATTIFNSNAANMKTVTNTQLNVSVVKSKGYINATVTATATYPTTFLGLFGFTTLPISAASSSQNGMPPYLDFYLLLDVSGSMGLPSTNSEETRLAAVNPDNKSLYPGGCTLACHFSGYQGYTLSRNGGNSHNPQVTSCPTPGTSTCIQLRLDAVGYAVNALIQTANQTQKYAQQFRIGLYPFIRYMYAYYPVTYNISGSITDPTTVNYAAANLATLLDTGANASLGSGGTHFENALPAVSTAIQKNGIGTGASASSRQPWVFFVTDGSQDSQYYWSGSWNGSNHATTLDPTLCTALKTIGIRIAVLYIPYQPIQNPNPSFAGDEDDYANNNIANIPAPLQSCASPGFYWTANSPADITTAMNAMFNAAVATDHLTQ